MSKRLNYYDRKKLFEARESGLSDTELKRRFGIKDNRTLGRHLKLAEQEERTSIVNLEILKDAKADHLSEIRTLMEQWQATLVTPQIHETYPSTSSQIYDIEAHPLYSSLRKHLPFPTLWRDYSLFRSKMSQYQGTCIELRERIRKRWKFQGTELTPSFEVPILRLVADRDRKLQYRLHIRVGHELNEFKYQVLMINDLEVVRGRESSGQQLRALEHEQSSKEAMPAEYQKVADSICETGASQAKGLFQVLKKLEAKLHESLQEIQLRHDYIMYTCKLCPGQPRLSR
jgi:hypothetical protein